jgi:hypothetical protein
VDIAWKKTNRSNTSRARERWRGEKGHGIIPSCPRVAGDADVPAMVGAALVLAVAEGRIAAAGTGSRRCVDGGRRWNFPPLLRHLRSVRADGVGGVAAATNLVSCAAGPPSFFYSAARRGPTS